MESFTGRLLDGSEVSSNVLFYEYSKKKSNHHRQTNSREQIREEEETVEREDNEEAEGEHEQPIDLEVDHQEAAQNHGTVNGPGLVSWKVSDPEVLDCSVCCEPLTIPVFQCKNGHIACETCCTGMNKCPYCSSTIGYDRCRAIEKVLESVEMECRNTKYGCKEKMSYSEKRDHEKKCRHAPCSCPLSECNFIGTSSKLYQHFSFRHKNAAVRFKYNGIIHITLEVKRKFMVLQEENHGDIFVLSNKSESHGHLISVRYIAPAWKGGIFYSIFTKYGGSNYRYQSTTMRIQNRRDNPPMDELLVPASYFGYYRQLKLGIRIRR